MPLDHSLPNQVYLCKLRIIQIKTSINVGIGSRLEIVSGKYMFGGGFDVICNDGEINTLSNR